MGTAFRFDATVLVLVFIYIYISALHLTPQTSTGILAKIFLIFCVLRVMHERPSFRMVFFLVSTFLFLSILLEINLGNVLGFGGKLQSIYNEDANQWTWTPEVGVEKEVLGPFDTVQVWVEKGIDTSMLARIYF